MPESSLESSVDLVLSSGFLAFAAQAGFLAGVAEAGQRVACVAGTSSGALAGSLFAAGVPGGRIAELLCEGRPTAGFRPHLRPWRGLFVLDPMVARLAELLPPRFEDLQLPLAVGVVTRSGDHQLLQSGPLPEAVAASCAVPYLFHPVRVGENWFIDGAAGDRLAWSKFDAWRSGGRPVVHEVEATSSTAREQVPATVTVVRSPGSGAKLWSLGDWKSRFLAAKAATIREIGPPCEGRRR